MTIEQFQNLHEYEQEEIVYETGVFIGNYVRGTKICDVYQMRNFYVKFCYLLTAHEKAQITAFLDPGNLPFIKEIDITDLLE